MTRDEAEQFVRKFQAAWAAHDGAMMGALWHADGQLLTPIIDRPVAGKELPQLVAAQLAIAPDLRWTLLGWSWSGDVVYIEWKVEQTIAGRPFEWAGMDRFILVDGLILEERVYADTAPLRAMRLETERQRAADASRKGLSPDRFFPF